MRPNFLPSHITIIPSSTALRNSPNLVQKIMWECGCGWKLWTAPSPMHKVFCLFPLMVVSVYVVAKDEKWSNHNVPPSKGKPYWASRSQWKMRIKISWRDSVHSRYIRYHTSPPATSYHVVGVKFGEVPGGALMFFGGGLLLIYTWWYVSHRFNKSADFRPTLSESHPIQDWLKDGSRLQLTFCGLWAYFGVFRTFPS